MKKIIVSLFILFCLSGCWNYKELNEYSIVTGIAIDKKDDKYEVSVLISNAPKSSTDNSSSESQIVVYSGTGSSVFEALKDIGLISPKELYLNSFSIFVLSEEVSKEGIDNVVDFFLRYSSSRNKFFVIVAKDVKAKDTLKIMTHLTNFPSQGISDNIKSTTNLQGTIAKMGFDELISILLRDGIDPVINSVEVIGDIEEGSKTENLESSSPETYIKIGTLGIFKNDKLIDWASHDESLGINMINGEISEMFLEVEYNDGYVVVDTTTFKQEIKTSVKDNKPHIDINLKGEARIIEVNGDIDLQKDKVIEELQEKCNDKIKENAKKAIKLAIKNKTDIFGFGLKFKQNHYNYYKTVKKDWNERLSEIDFKINSELILKNKVSSKNSLEVIHDK